MRPLYYLFFFATLVGCDSTTPEQIVANCVSTGVSGYSSEYCACAAQAIEPSEDMLSYFAGLSDVRKQVKDLNDSVGHNGLNVTALSYQTSTSSICKQEATSSRTAVASIPTEVLCWTVDEDMNMVQTSDPDVCPTPSIPDAEDDMSVLYEYGCSLIDAPENQLIFTMEARVENTTTNPLQILTTEKVGSTATNYLNDPEYLALSEEASSAFSDYDAAAKQMNYVILKQVENLGEFSFGSISVTDIETRQIASTSEVVNHDRFDFFGASSNLDAGKSVVSAVSFLVPSDLTSSYFWKGSEGEVLNLDSVPVTYDLLEILFSEEIATLHANADIEDLVQISSSCVVETPNADVKDALELL